MIYIQHILMFIMILFSIVHISVVQKEFSALKMIVDMLVKLKVTEVLDYQNKECSTALHLAADTQQLSAVQLLVTAGASCDVSDKDGDTPVHISVLNNDSSVLALLLQHQVSVHLLIIRLNVHDNDKYSFRPTPTCPTTLVSFHSTLLLNTIFWMWCHCC